MTIRMRIVGIIVAVLLAAVLWLAISLWRQPPPAPAHALAPGVTAMKAIVYRDYGSPDVLRLEQVEKPSAAEHQLLIRVRAVSVNPLDWHYMRGKPYIMRLQSGARWPQDIRLGVDFAGTVESVGKGVTHFKPGDEVFGGADDAFAEFVTVPEDGPIALKPANVSFEQAAAVPIAAITALQGLRDKGHLQAGQKVLINGASGGVGTFAVQLAKSFGAEVTGVCSTHNVDMVRSLGADHVIDYTKEDFTRDAQRYDLIIDNVGNHSLLEFRRALTPHGLLIIIGGPSTGALLGPLTRPIHAMFLSPFVGQKFSMFLAHLNSQDMNLLASLMQAGKLTPVIDRHYPFGELPDAIRYLEQGHARGKVVVDVD